MEWQFKFANKSGHAEEIMKTSSLDRNQIFNQCQYFLHGSKPRSLSDAYAELLEWCKEHQVEADAYGTGEILQSLESEVASLLGFESALFMPSGTMAQVIALRIWAEHQKNFSVGMHLTSHLECHEFHSYNVLHNLSANFLGSASRIFTATDVETCPIPLGSVVLELPCRELGGVLPNWDELSDIKATCERKKIKLHLDGARLWECSPYYEKSYREICEGFHSAYVSFYKGLGAFTGAMLLGPRDFINEAKIWQRRHGGNLYQLHPYAISAKIGFKKHLGSFPLRYKTALDIATVLREFPDLIVSPQIPQTNMFHLYIRRGREKFTEARDSVAVNSKVWLCGGLMESSLPGWIRTEISVSEDASLCPAEKIRDWWKTALNSSF